MKKNILIGILCAALIIVGIWAVINSSNVNSYKTAMEISADKEYSALTACALELSNTLEKCSVSADPAYTAESLAEISSLAARAQGLITGLPLSHIMSSSTVEYLSQTQEYAKYLSYRLFEQGGDLSEEEKKALESMSASALVLYNELASFAEDVAADDFKWYSKNKAFFFDDVNGHFVDGFSAMEESFAEYPQINYDGKYSDHLNEFTAKGLGEGEYNSDMLLEQIKASLGDKAADYEIKHISDNASDIASSAYSVSDGTDIFTLNYSSTGGNLLSAISNITVDESVLTTDEAIKAASEFINKLGLKDMVFSSASNADNITTVKFVYMKEGVKCLMDNVSVQVSMADGRILGYEASDYYNYHDEARTIEQPQITAEQAAEKVSKDLTVSDTALTLLQTDGKNELLCYEITASKEDMLFKIYIDAETGAERRIVRVINNENGTSVF